MDANAVNAEIARLKAENAALQAIIDAKANAPITFKVSELGALSAYGLGRFPVTLYKSQWERLLSNVDAIKAALKTHNAALATGKDDARFADVRAKRKAEESK